MRPWPAENIAAMKRDAAAGLTFDQCARLHRFHPSTMEKHARLHGISFRHDPPPERLSHDEMRSRALFQAEQALRREIAAARREAATAPLYRGGW